MKLSKDFKIFLLVILMGIILFFVYIWWPSKQIVVETKPEATGSMVYEAPEQVEIIPTADPKWNLYRNFKYGFQIQYPAEWKFIRIYRNNDGILVGFSPTSIDSYIIFNMYFNKSLDALLKDLKMDEQFLSIKQSTLSSKVMYKITTRNPYLDHDSYVYAFNSKNKTLSLGSDGSPSNSWYIDKMISTLEIF